MDSQTKVHSPERMLFCLGCLSLLMTLASGCDPELPDAILSVDDRVAVDAELHHALAPAPTPPVASDDDRVEALDLFGKSEATHNTDDIWIESVTASGVGCPTDSTQLVTNNPGFFLQFNDMLLTNPRGATTTSTNCVVGVKLHVSSGWQVAVSSIVTNGLTVLESKLEARMSTKYFLAGEQIGAGSNVAFKGAYNDNYDLVHHNPGPTAVWSACGTSTIIEIDTSLTLDATAKPRGLGSISSTYLGMQLRSRRC